MYLVLVAILEKSVSMDLDHKRSDCCCAWYELPAFAYQTHSAFAAFY